MENDPIRNIGKAFVEAQEIQEKKRIQQESKEYLRKKQEAKKEVEVEVIWDNSFFTED